MAKRKQEEIAGLPVSHRDRARTGVCPSRLDLPMPMDRQDQVLSLCAYRNPRTGNPHSQDVPGGETGVRQPEYVGRQSRETMPSTVFVFVKCNLFDGPISHLYFVLFK